MVNLTEKPSVKVLRGELQITQRQLAEKCDLDVGTIKRAEKGVSSIQYLKAVRIIKALEALLHEKSLLPTDQTLNIWNVDIKILGDK